LVGRLVIWNKAAQIVSWCGNGAYIFRVLATIKPVSRSPRQSQIECPECEELMSASKLSEHLKAEHWFPGSGFSGS
jgi:hypothetical protein